MFKIKIINSEFGIYLLIIHGYDCGDSCDCNMSKKCKHINHHRFHNFSVKLHRFFEYKLHVKLPHLIYITKKYVRFSGTHMCPYNKPRNYICHDCEFICGPLLRDCRCKDNKGSYLETTYVDDHWGRKCKYFKKCSWADDYKTEYNNIKRR